MLQSYETVLFLQHTYDLTQALNNVFQLQLKLRTETLYFCDLFFEQ